MEEAFGTHAFARILRNGSSQLQPWISTHPMGLVIHKWMLWWHPAYRSPLLPHGDLPWVFLPVQDLSRRRMPGLPITHILSGPWRNHQLQPLPPFVPRLIISAPGVRIWHGMEDVVQGELHGVSSHHAHRSRGSPTLVQILSILGQHIFPYLEAHSSEIHNCWILRAPIAGREDPTSTTDQMTTKRRSKQKSRLTPR